MAMHVYLIEVPPRKIVGVLGTSDNAATDPIPLSRDGTAEYIVCGSGQDEPMRNWDKLTFYGFRHDHGLTFQNKLWLAKRIGGVLVLGRVEFPGSQ